ncbi:VCBS domain-containing protein [Paramagnetospirillum magneticum]|uniref:Cell surface glycoprotein n=1 Tax=Paramagnetospirillum magneticum (strain ATCC 700264 / AMB-1) TaxID=342108 RepID=Q2W5S8_PARM1|nr:VCBS domain-containing protein [Paramagnetospirillum magneticum]BAE50797.1 Cell surface glycoprotein precursor [Paramagnetospirillum magneticum AMB-1]
MAENNNSNPPHDQHDGAEENAQQSLDDLTVLQNVQNQNMGDARLNVARAVDVSDTQLGNLANVQQGSTGSPQVQNLGGIAGGANISVDVEIEAAKDNSVAPPELDGLAVDIRDEAPTISVNPGGAKPLNVQELPDLARPDAEFRDQGRDAVPQTGTGPVAGATITSQVQEVVQAEVAAAPAVDNAPDIQAVAVNHAPIVAGVADIGTIDEDHPLTMTAAEWQAKLLANATDSDGDTLSILSLDDIRIDHGSFARNADGTYTFTPDANFNGEINATYTISDGHGGLATGSASLHVNAVNDAAEITGDTAVVVGEDTARAAGNLDATDIDSPATFVAATTADDYGTFSVDESGQWSFAMNDSVQSLGAGDHLTRTFEVQTADGTSQTVTVTIDGANDQAVISGDAKDLSGSVGEDGTQTATGTLHVSDVDSGEAHVQATSVETDQGTFTIGEDGKWSFALNNDDPAVQALGANDSMTKTFTVTSADGTDTQEVTVTIHGSNDSATISGDIAGGVGEDGTGTATGTLNVSDVDSGEAHVQATSVETDQGTFTIGEDGKWSFALNNDDPAVQALGANDSMTKTFTVTSADGTDTQEVTVTIHGSNDSATISGDIAGGVGEDGTSTATGTLNVADVDNGEAHVQATSVETDQGTFTIGEDGKWSFALNNDDPAVQALGANESMTKTFTVTSADGTDTQEVTVTINGSNDSATISGDIAGL